MDDSYTTNTEPSGLPGTPGPGRAGEIKAWREQGTASRGAFLTNERLSRRGCIAVAVATLLSTALVLLREVEWEERAVATLADAA